MSKTGACVMLAHIRAGLVLGFVSVLRAGLALAVGCANDAHTFARTPASVVTSIPPWRSLLSNVNTLCLGTLVITNSLPARVEVPRSCLSPNAHPTDVDPKKRCTAPPIT